MSWEKQHADLRVALLGRKHDTLVRLWDRDEIDDSVLQQVQAVLDLERVAVDRHRDALTVPSAHRSPRHLRSPTMRTVGRITMIVAVAAGLASCSSSADTAPAATTAGPAPAATAAVADLPACTADDITVTGASGSKPTISVPDTCSPPKQLLSKDLVVGTGPEVTTGVTMQTHYDLVTWSDKQELDSSWSRGEPFPLENVGNAQVIDGWNEGLIGMKEGGRRLLVVPADKGYGQGGNGIRPGETLVFVVDAVKVTS